jgi:hypothetical protein
MKNKEFKIWMLNRTIHLQSHVGKAKTEAEKLLILARIEELIFIMEKSKELRN